jgi:hypothetical protein
MRETRFFLKRWFVSQSTLIASAPATVTEASLVQPGRVLPQTGLTFSDHDHTKAITHPSPVQPRETFTRVIATASRW